MDKKTIFVFDKRYNDYKAFKKLSDNETGFVTRIKDNAVYKTVWENQTGDHIHSGVLQDETIGLTVKEPTTTNKLRLRKIRFYDRALKREFEFLTNLFEM